MKNPNFIFLDIIIVFENIFFFGFFNLLSLSIAT